MRIYQLWLQRVAKLGLLLMIGASINACSTSWREEALLHDGSKVVVTRTIERGGRHEIGQRPPIKNQSISFVLPDTNEKVKWEDSYTEDIGGANFLPMQLDIVKGTAYLTVYPMGCLSYNKWGRPNPPYVIFKYKNNGWNRIALQDLPLDIETPNLIFSDPDGQAERIGRSLITAEMIRRIIDDYKHPEYKTIFHEPIRSAGTGCGELIRVKDGWEGTGFFSGQPSKEACLKYCDRQEVSVQNCPCNRFFK